jgi:hypothetical protein
MKTADFPRISPDKLVVAIGGKTAGQCGSTPSASVPLSISRLSPRIRRFTVMGYFDFAFGGEGGGGAGCRITFFTGRLRPFFRVTLLFSLLGTIGTG